MKAIKLTADGAIKEFGPAHAQAILRHQEKTKCVNCWEIVEKDKYEFTKGELNAIKRNKKPTRDETESVGSTASKDPTK